MENKKKPSIYGAILQYALIPKSPTRSIIEAVAFFHGTLDCHCPKEFLPGLIEMLESNRAFVFRANIEEAIKNLKAQLEECSTE